jgi:hypothetical protein
MTVLETIKYIDRREAELRAEAEERAEAEKQRLEQEQHKPKDYIYQNFEIFVKEHKHVVNTRFLIVPPDYEDRRGSIR